MIPNCKGCQIEREMIEEYSKLGLHFAGKGLGEKGHIVLIMVDDNGKVIVE